MIHHIITLACNKKCPYCINELQELGNDCRKHATLMEIEKTYNYLTDPDPSIADKWRCFPNQITITGGEPSIYRDFKNISFLARKYFEEVNLITAYRDVLTSDEFEWCDKVFDNISFSLHKPYMSEFSNKHGFNLINKRKCNVYLSCITDMFEELVNRYIISTTPETLIGNMLENGFDGITIREEWPSGKRIGLPIPMFANFSVRYEKNTHCQDQVFLMPDLSIKTNKK